MIGFDVLVSEKNFLADTSDQYCWVGTYPTNMTDL
jgi:hypothetical protein